MRAFRSIAENHKGVAEMADKNLSDRAYSELLRRIITCEYAPGVLLSEERLVMDLGCSRTPIRSALVRLQEEHLVQILSKRGIRVVPITLSDIRDVYNLRELFETYALEKYGMNFKKERLVEVLRLFESSGPEDDFYYNDMCFHNEIISQTQNAFLGQYFVSLQNTMQRLSRLSGAENRNRVEESNQEHTRIILALLRDDFSGAADALRLHLNNGRISAYQVVLDEQSEDSRKRE